MRKDRLALSLLEEGVRLVAQICDLNHPYIARAYCNIGLIYDLLGDSEKSLEFS